MSLDNGIDSSAYSSKRRAGDSSGNRKGYTTLLTRPTPIVPAATLKSCVRGTPTAAHDLIHVETVGDKFPWNPTRE